MLVFKTLSSCIKQEAVYFVICPKQEPKMEGVVLHRVGILAFIVPKQGHGLKHSAVPLYPKGKIALKLCCTNLNVSLN